jgi:hypothetical protein
MKEPIPYNFFILSFLFERCVIFKFFRKSSTSVYKKLYKHLIIMFLLNELSKDDDLYCNQGQYAKEAANGALLNP